MKNRFRLGQIVTTKRIDTKMKEDFLFMEFVQLSLGRYVLCNWGDICDEDKHANDIALRDGDRIFAVYKHEKSETTIWIITEWDRSVTTILFPDEY